MVGTEHPEDKEPRRTAEKADEKKKNRREEVEQGLQVRPETLQQAPRYTNLWSRLLLVQQQKSGAVGTRFPVRGWPSVRRLLLPAQKASHRQMRTGMYGLVRCRWAWSSEGGARSSMACARC